MRMAVLLSLSVLVACNQAPRPQPGREPTQPTPKITRLSDWTRTETVNKMDGVKQTALMKFAKEGEVGSLLIRCTGRKTEAFVTTGQIVEDKPVRIKFDDDRPVRQSWSRAESYDALFAPNGIAFARELSKHRLFLIEFKPLDKTPEVLEFDLNGLDQNIASLAEQCDWPGADRAAAQVRKHEREDVHKRAMTLYNAFSDRQANLFAECLTKANGKMDQQERDELIQIIWDSGPMTTTCDQLGFPKRDQAKLH